MRAAVDVLLILGVLAMFGNFGGAITGAYPYRPFLFASIGLAVLAGVVALLAARR